MPYLAERKTAICFFAICIVQLFCKQSLFCCEHIMHLLRSLANFMSIISNSEESQKCMQLAARGNTKILDVKYFYCQI